MAIDLTKETKNVISLTLEDKIGPTWDQDNETWDNSNGTWNEPGVVINLEQKNVTSLSLENKNA